MSRHAGTARHWASGASAAARARMEVRPLPITTDVSIHETNVATGIPAVLVVLTQVLSGYDRSWMEKVGRVHVPVSHLGLSHCPTQTFRPPHAHNSPDMARTCCPQYTIRLDVAQFKTTRQQRSAVNRWNRFLETSLKPGEGGGDDAMVGTDKKGKGKAKAFDLMTEIRAHQVGYGEGKRRFQVGAISSTH